jgi:nitroreductase
MMYNATPSQLIRQRYSCRTYQKQPLTNQDIRSLKLFSQQNQVGPRGNQIRYQILSASPYQDSDYPKLGTYGFIKDPAAFIAGAITDQPGALEDFGYTMELVILKATEMEIGSCWLGGSFTKSRFAALMDLQAGETIPAVTSLGYPSDQRGWIDRVARVYAGADRRVPWEDLFFTNQWEQVLTSDQAKEYLEPLQAVRLAPSASNKQPWRLLQDNNKWHFYLERTHNYPPPVFGPLLGIADLQRVDLGIAMAHFSLSVSEAGLHGEWIEADPGFTRDGTKSEYIITWQARERVQ